MNSYQAKQIPIHSFLEKLGHIPKSKKGTDLWYCSPLRNENTPSFKVNLQLNTWYDHGPGIGGTIIDLVCEMYQESVRDALNRLDSNFITERKIYNQPKTEPIKPKEKVFELVGTKKITHKALHCYLKERCINPDIAKKYLCQVDFRVKTQNKESIQFALGFKNDAGDFEFRNRNFKGFLGNTKTITSINIQENNKIALFEGFFDFLSFLTDYNITDFKSSAIILNSTSMESKAQELLKSNNFETAYFFLDNDDTGKKSFERLSEGLPYPVKNKSSIYVGYGDYNEYLKNKLGTAEEKEKRGL